MAARITDFDTSGLDEFVVFGGRLLPLTPESIHALSLNAQQLAIGERDEAISPPHSSRRGDLPT